MPLLKSKRSGISYPNKELWQVLLRYQIGRSKFIAVDNQSAFVTIVTHFAGDHFNRHANLDSVIIYIGELGSNHGTLFKFDEGNSVGCVGIITTRGFVDSGI